MKTLKQISLIAIVGIFFIACNQKNAPTQELKTLEVTIEGMTCQIGCARTIQAKVAKMEGVNYADVNFEAKKGIFTYDAVKISEEEIVKKINNVADGKLYKVISKKEVELIMPKQ